MKSREAAVSCIAWTGTAENAVDCLVAKRKLNNHTLPLHLHHTCLEEGKKTPFVSAPPQQREEQVCEKAEAPLKDVQ